MTAPGETPSSARHAPPVSRGLRALTGAWLLFVVAINLIPLHWETALTIIGLFLGLLAYYIIVHRLVARHPFILRARLVVALAPLSMFFLLQQTGVQLGILVFYGLSLFVQGVRGDRGCEVMTLPSILIRERSYMPCLLFSPLDRLEERVRHVLTGRT